MTVACEAEDWIAAHALKRQHEASCYLTQQHTVGSNELCISASPCYVLLIQTRFPIQPPHIQAWPNIPSD